ncbi:hybrid sensor histidine kinase/response regulator [Paracoccus spongiarum]|uniref:histidine kinase n=1 Tax=Paracoccus spongiarum TaxID=3064387 RepID=A0ABT9JDP7_9RHOB|nr:ATP-binding protein [Paracoccus sp. 2205BS29-5]MDP5307740.1 ATP-binding protein [Paracoccus sp. 2205BS29-5]
MAHWDDQLGIPRSALSALPLLLLPTAVGALVLLVLPGAGAGKAAIVFSTVAVAWYLLGGAMSLSHGLRQIAGRRALAAIRGEVAATPEPVWICDCESRVLFQNTAAREDFGDIAGQNIVTLLGRLRADAEGDLADLSARSLRTGCAELALPNGDSLALSRAADAPLQVWSYHRPGEVAQLAEVEMALALDDEDGVDDFEVMPVALLRLGPDGTIRRANAAARRLLGARLPADDAQVQLGSLLEGPGRPLGDWIADACAGRTDGRAEMLRLRQPAGDARLVDAGRDTHFQVSLSSDPLHKPGLIAVLSDASALKTLEAQFVQSQKMQAIGQLAGGVAHDFNNLLTAISGHCDLLMLRHDKGHPDYADLDQISQNANRAAALVGQLLAFSRKQTLRLETLDLRDTLADLTHLLNRLVGERVGLAITHDPALRPIRADKRQLEQVIMNLVVNARDAMPEGGEIRIDTETLHLAAPLSRDRAALPRGDYVRVSVTDEGCGIPAEIRDKIFEPFFTTKRTGEGTGLGLSTAYGIVKQTGGYIFCDSTPGRGTTFSLYFPAHAGAARPVAPPLAPIPAVASEPQPVRQATVLLVEDEAPVRAFAARALRLKGYDVREADSAEQALDLLGDSRLKVDVFVTDVVMPGMDGPSWVRTALKDRPGTRVVFMSGYTEDIFGEGHAPVPNSLFLAKPFTLAELTGSVERQLSGGEAPPLH